MLLTVLLVQYCIVSYVTMILFEEYGTIQGSADGCPGFCLTLQGYYMSVYIFTICTCTY